MVTSGCDLWPFAMCIPLIRHDYLGFVDHSFAALPNYMLGPPNRVCQFWYFCVKVHKNALFHTKYLKNFLGMGHTPSPDPILLGRATPTLQTLLCCHLWLLVSVPQWLKAPLHSKNPGYVPAAVHSFVNNFFKFLNVNECSEQLRCLWWCLSVSDKCVCLLAGLRRESVMECCSTTDDTTSGMTLCRLRSSTTTSSSPSHSAPTSPVLLHFHHPAFSWVMVTGTKSPSPISTGSVAAAADLHLVLMKKCHWIFGCTFASCWPIFKIPSLTDLAVNAGKKIINIQLHLKRVNTLPCKTLMLEKWHYSEISIMITVYDKVV